MLGRPVLMFKVKLKQYGEIRNELMELPLIFFSAFERVALESDDKMHRMGKIIQLYEPGPLPALEAIMHVGFLSHVLCSLVQSTTNSLLHIHIYGATTQLFLFDLPGLRR